MKFISDSGTLSSTFEYLCKKYQHYKWSVAWAGDPDHFPLSRFLKKSKIEEITIGLHFYQTSPKFIRKHLNDSRIRYILDTNGTFHPKIYLFYNSESDWSALVGSSNFTNAGFFENTEANVLISNDDHGCTFREISSSLSETWNNAKCLNRKEVDAYEQVCKQQKAKLKNLKKYKNSILGAMIWTEYLEKIRNVGSDSFELRLRLLDKAQQLFRRNEHFNDLSVEDRRKLAGYQEKIDSDGINWLSFGSMKGAGIYKNAITNNIKIGNAIDLIPIQGPVDKEQFDEYCKAFDGWKNPIACATRLLAVKRPDLFICINSKNRKELSKYLNIPASHFTLDRYWSEILPKIYDYDWFNTNPANMNHEGRKVKKYQVALLDCLVYRN